MDWHNTLESVAIAWGFISAIAVSISPILLWILVGYNRLRFLYRLGIALHQQLGDDPIPKIDRISELFAVSEIRRLLIESTLGLSIFVCGKDGKCRDSNENLANLFGLDRSGTLGFGWLDCVCPEDRERVHESWMYAIRNGLPYECEYTVRNRRLNTEYVVVSRAYPVLSTKGEVYYYVGSVKKETPYGEEKTSVGSIG